MIKTLTHVSPTDPLVGKIQANHGGFNSFPANWREVTAEELAGASGLMGYTPEAVEMRQMLDRVKNQTVMATLYHMADGTGWAMERVYWGPNKGFRYYRFGCAHRMREITDPAVLDQMEAPRGHCLHTWQCSDCGHTQTVDSSD